MPPAIRSATPADVPTILGLIRALADYEKLSAEVVATEDRLRQSLFPDNAAAPAAYCVIAEADSTAAGFALYFFNYSTFLARPGLYLEDLFVRPEFRGRGLGKAESTAIAHATWIGSAALTLLFWAAVWFGRG